MSQTTNTDTDLWSVEDEHGHAAQPCTWCPRPEICDCPCALCIRSRLAAAGCTDICIGCGSKESVTDGECARCYEAWLDLKYGDDGFCGSNCVGCADCRPAEEEAEDDYDEDEVPTRRCIACRGSMDGDEGWGPHCCSRGCAHKLLYGE